MTLVQKMEKKEGKGQGKSFHGDEIMALRSYEMFVISALCLALSLR